MKKPTYKQFLLALGLIRERKPQKNKQKEVK